LLNAAGEGSYVNDPYIKQNKVQSLLCAPILNKGELSGIIYLENDLTTGAFTKDRIEILQILASQAAISIDNARLYDNLEGRVKQRTKEIGDIMNNVEQGIFTINKDLTINPEYSKKVMQIFARNDFGHKHFTAIFPQEIRSKLETFLIQLFQNKFMSEKMFQSINPLKNYLLQLEKLNSKQLSFHFSRIYKEDENGNTTKEIDKVMVVVEDKTEEFQLQLQLQAKADEQASKVEKLYQILNLEPAVFTGFLKEGSEVIAVVRGKLSGGVKNLQEKQNIEEAYRAVHTLKGNARALGLDSIGKVCHTLEDELEKVRNNREEIDETLHKLVEQGIDRVELELKDGNSLFEKILGMKTALKTISSSPTSSLESLLRNIAKKEGEEQQKKIDFSFKSESNDSILEEKLKIVKSPLLQMIRNSISHGIEKPTERKQLGKPETGKLTIQIQENDKQLIVICEDDGRGLDPEKLRQKAIEKGVIPASTAKTLSTSECHNLIFHPGFSTAKKITQTSGRGVGMDIVKHDIEQAGGKVAIFTVLGEFTRLVITL
ncbi:MAG: Hpt domain-containing protein, partial [Spirochaetota bacterium]